MRTEIKAGNGSPGNPDYRYEENIQCDIPHYNYQGNPERVLRVVEGNQGHHLDILENIDDIEEEENHEGHAPARKASP